VRWKKNEAAQVDLERTSTSLTVTVNEQSAVRPLTSVARNCTKFAPTAKAKAQKHRQCWRQSRTKNKCRAKKPGNALPLANCGESNVIDAMPQLSVATVLVVVNCEIEPNKHLIKHSQTWRCICHNSVALCDNNNNNNTNEE
jgi:hypothetical protein